MPLQICPTLHLYAPRKPTQELCDANRDTHYTEALECEKVTHSSVLLSVMMVTGIYFFAAKASAAFFSSAVVDC